MQQLLGAEGLLVQPLVRLLEVLSTGQRLDQVVGLALVEIAGLLEKGLLELEGIDPKLHIWVWIGYIRHHHQLDVGLQDELRRVYVRQLTIAVLLDDRAQLRVPGNQGKEGAAAR